MNHISAYAAALQISDGLASQWNNFILSYVKKNYVKNYKSGRRINMWECNGQMGLSWIDQVTRSWYFTLRSRYATTNFLAFIPPSADINVLSLIMLT